MRAAFTRLTIFPLPAGVRLPALTGAAALLAAWLLILLDRLLQLAWPAFGAPARSDPQTARFLLAMIALIMALCALTEFQLANAAWQAAVRRFGLRALAARFYRQRLAALVSAPVGVAVFSLATLAAVRSTTQAFFVPHLAIAAALFAGIACLALAAWSLRAWQRNLEAPHVIAQLAQALIQTIETPAAGRQPPRFSSPPISKTAVQTAMPVRTGQAGYVQFVDFHGLGLLAERHDLRLRLGRRPGEFVRHDEILATAAPAARLDSRLALRIRQAFAVGADPAAFGGDCGAAGLLSGLENLGQIGVQALAQNCPDAFLARQCIDWLGAILARLAEVGIPPTIPTDTPGHARLQIDRPIDFSGLLSAALDELRPAIGGRAGLYTHLLLTLQRVMQVTIDPAAQEGLIQQAILIRRAAHAALQERHEREAIETHFALVMQAQRGMS